MTMPDATCSIERCPKPAKYGGLCGMHAERKRLHGDPGPAEPHRGPGRVIPRCSAVACTNDAKALGLCGKHYYRLRANGSPEVVQRDVKGWITREDGYRYIWKPDHPLAMSWGYVAEHRMVVHDAGIPIPAGHHVHHLNGDKLDNRLENLEVISESEHHRHHVREQGYVVNQYGTWPLRN